MNAYAIRYDAKSVYRQGGGQEDNPHPLGSEERFEWGLAMHECQQEEYEQLMRGFA